ncbi:MAG: hypothetical protein H6Q89_5613, partial [Myxococcaceae bacterium]|nr:hypothetical protein [Myxococcaceae bacterium]
MAAESRQDKKLATRQALKVSAL